MPHHFHKLPMCKRTCTPLCGSRGSRCKSSREHPFKDSSVADSERHRSRKSEHVGAKPTGGSISNTLHVVTVSIPRCERGGAGANPAVGTSFMIVRKAKSRACGSQVHRTQCESGAHVRFRAWLEPRRHLSHKQASGSIPAQPTFRIRESQRTHLVWDQDAPGAAPGYSTIFGL